MESKKLSAEELSIIIPVYNSEKYLSQCLDSILKQEDFIYEIILIDDGSTDSTDCSGDESKLSGICG